MASGTSRTVTLNVVADTADANRKLAATGDAAGKAGDKAHDAGKKGASGFSALTGALGQAQSGFSPILELVDTAKEQFEHLHESTSKIGGGLLAMGGVATATGVLLQAAASKDQEATGQLRASIEATGNSYDDYEKAIEANVKAQERFGHTADQTKDALNILTQATHDPNDALNRMQLVTDLAAQKHISLSDAAGLVAKTLGGSTRLFKQYGIEVHTSADGTKDINGALGELSHNLTGQAAASASTFSGHLSAMKAHFEDIVAEVGGKVGPALTTIGPIAMGAGALVESGLLGNLKKIPEKAGNALESIRSMGAGGVVSLGLLGAAIAGVTYGIAHNGDEIKKYLADIDKLPKPQLVDPSSLSSVQAVTAAFGANTSSLQGNIAAQEKIKDDTNQSDDARRKALVNILAERDMLAANADAQKHYNDTLHGAAQQLGITDEQAQTLVHTYGVDLSGTADQAAAALKNAETAAAADGLAMGSTSAQSGVLAAAMKTLGDSTSKTTDDLSALNSIMDVLIGTPMAVRQSTDAFDKSLQTLTTTARQAGRTQGDLTDSLDGAESALQAQASATYKAVNATQGQQAAAAAAAQVLAAGKIQIDRYAAANGYAIGDINAVNSELGGTISALQQVAGDAANAGTYLNQLPKYVNVEVHYAQTGSIATGGQVRGYATGGWVPGTGSGDTVPAMLTPGEYVLTPPQARAYAAHGAITPAAGGGGGVIVNVAGSLIGGTPQDVADALAPHIVQPLQHQAFRRGGLKLG